jgi:hypothetical protein
VIDVRRRDGRMLRIGHRALPRSHPRAGSKLKVDGMVTNDPRIFGDYTSSP